MFTFKKCSKRLKRTVCVALCLIVLSSLLVIPAGAADWSGSGEFSVYNYLNGTRLLPTYLFNFQSPVSGSDQSSVVFSDTSLDDSEMGVYPWRIEFNNTNQSFEGSLGIYFSWYFSADFDGVWSSPDLSQYYVDMRFYLPDSTYENVPTSGAFKFSSFSPLPVDGYSVSRGALLKGRVSHVDSIVDVQRIWLGLSYLGSVPPYVIDKPSGVSGSITCHVPSSVLVGGLSGAELDALEGIADGIAAQSQIMSAYYGDIMEILNNLYSRLGDIQSVQETANSYFAQLIPLVNSINTNTANIHSLLQTQFQLLRTLIATESGNIQDAIEQQTQDLIAYFDTVLSGSTGNMPEKSDDLESSVGNVSDAESNYQSTATERFDQLAGAFTGFSGGTLGGVTLAATLFSRVWSALGEYSIVYSWPLLLGICLVVIGRLSRLSGGQSSSVKNRGDSDA